MYLLNLLVNFNTLNGRFSGDAAGSPLKRSVNWLRLNAADEPDPNTFDPETATWSNVGESGTVLIPRREPPNPEDNICIRVAAHPDGPGLPDDATAQIVVSFGRSVRASQERASPFVEGDEARTTFIFGPRTRNTTAGWYFPLAQIGVRPPNHNSTHRYEFSVGVIVSSGGKVRAGT